MVDNSRGWGGAEELLLSLATELRNRGHYVGMFLRDSSPTVEKLTAANFPVWTAKRNGISYLIYMFKLAAVVRNEKIDLIHVHRSHDVIVSSFAALVGRVPLVLTQHTHLSKWSSLLVFLTSRIVAVSAFVAKGICANVARSKNKVVVIHNGIKIHKLTDRDPDYWKKKLGKDVQGPLLGVVGFFYKNQQELIELLPDIRSVFPSAMLIVIGQDDHNKWMLEEKAASLGVTESVYFAGQIPHNEMHKALGALDLNLSAYKREPFGLHVIEGMASGTPLVAYQAGGFPEIVEHNRSGYLATTKDDLLQAIISILGDRQRLDRMSRYGRKKVERDFSILTMVTKYESLYSELVNKNC